jgi:GAF domain-containing protein
VSTIKLDQQIMIAAPLPADESARMEALHRARLLDCPPEATFERLVHSLAAAIRTPIAALSLIDHDRQWFLSSVGLNVSETPREVSFCAHAIANRATLSVPDVFEDARFFNNPLVADPHNFRAYLGAPLITEQGYALGALCVLDTKPREWTNADVTLIVDLACTAAELINARSARLELHDLVQAAGRARSGS